MIKPEFLSKSPPFRPGYRRWFVLWPDSLLENACHVFSYKERFRWTTVGAPGAWKALCKVKPLAIRPDNNPLCKEGFPVLFRAVPGLFRMMRSEGCRTGAKPFPVQVIPSWTKSCSGCGGILWGRGISATFFLQTVPQAVLPRIVGETTKTRSLDCLQGLGSAHERQQSARRR